MGTHDDFLVRGNGPFGDEMTVTRELSGFDFAFHAITGSYPSVPDAIIVPVDDPTRNIPRQPYELSEKASKYVEILASEVEKLRISRRPARYPPIDLHAYQVWKDAS